MDQKINKEISEKVEAWLADYEIPVSVFGVVSALSSLGYLSIRPTMPAPDLGQAVANPDNDDVAPSG